MNQGWVYRDQIPQSKAGMTVLDYYTRHYPHSSAIAWQERIITAQVQLDNQPTTAETRLQPGQWLTYHRPPWIEPPVPLNFEVLHDDPDLLIVAKPAGLPVLPGGGFLEHTLLWQLKRRYPHDTPYPIHRLGRGTSGLMLLARSPQARANLSQQLRGRQMRKTYRALIGHSDLPDTFTITQAIGKIAHPILRYVYGATPDGKAAYSECRVLQRQTTRTLLEVTILTGRPHQIRIHLASMGYPLLGDPLYAVGGIPRQITNELDKLPVPGDGGYQLHAYRLTFTHPHTQEIWNVLCPAPPNLTYLSS